MLVTKQWRIFRMFKVFREHLELTKKIKEKKMLLTMQCKSPFTKRITVCKRLHHKVNPPHISTTITKNALRWQP